MAAIIVRSTIGFLASLTAMTVIIVVGERRKGRTVPIWAAIGIILLLLVLYTSAASLSGAHFLAAFARSGWQPSNAIFGYFVAYFVSGVVAVLGMWGGNILLQLCCNALRRFLGMPLEKIRLYRGRK